MTMTKRTGARRAIAAAALALLAPMMAATDAQAATGTVSTGGSTLTLRSSASTSGTALVNIPDRTALNLVCRQSGTSVSGTQGTTTTWDRTSYGGKTGYVSAAYVSGGTTTSIPVCGKGTVRTSGSTLTLRSSASTSGTALISIPDGTVLTLQCKASGSSVSGTQGTTTVWDKVSYGGKTGYVSAAYVWGGTNSFVSLCGTVSPQKYDSPVASNAVITSSYGPRWGTFHYGTDFGYSGGTGPIYSACNGTVDAVRINPTYPNSNTYPTSGTTNYVWVNCGGGVRMGYAHVYARDIKVVVGSRVTTGQYLFPIGNQGYSTGPHLHFEVKLDGANTDPVPFLRNKGVTVP